jgi:hypothetical protein
MFYCINIVRMPECRGAGFVYLKAQKVKCWVSCTFIEMRFIITQLNWCFWWLEPYCLDCRLLIREPTVSLRRFLFTHKPKMEHFLFVWLRFLWTQVTTTKSRWTYSLKKNLSCILQTHIFDDYNSKLNLLSIVWWWNFQC